MRNSVGWARAWSLLILTLLVALLAAGALFATLGRGPAWLSGRGQPGDVAGTPAIRPDTSGASGVNLDASELAAPDLEERLAALEASGVHWLRVRLPWDQIEPERGQFRWENWDRVFAALARHPALQPLVVLDGSPRWARAPQDADNPLAPPQTRADFGTFASDVAQRYRDHVRYYQIWDEPNIAPHWGARPVDPAGYLGLLREGTNAIRATDGDALIVLAALAPNIEAGGANQSDIAYLDQLYLSGARPWFDIVAAEPYGFSQPPGAASAPQQLNFARAALIREVMLRHGDANTPVWATAFGWNALPGAWKGKESPWGQVSDAEQSRYVAEALALARTRWPWLGPMFWAATCPPAGSRAADDPWWGFALCRPDGERRDAWDALAAAGQTVTVVPPGDHGADYPALHYSPGWRVTAHGADPSANGDRLTFNFFGRDLALRVQRGPFWAYYRILVDGRPANALPLDEQGNAYLVLDDPRGEAEVVPVARNLPLGEHQVVLDNVGGWDQWALQGILVSAATGPLVPKQAWLLALLAALVAWSIVGWPWRAVPGRQLARLDEVSAGWPPGLVWGAAAVLGLALMLSPSQSLNIVLLLALGLLFLVRPEMMLPLIAFSIPLWPQTRALLSWQFSAYELLIWVGTGAFVLRWLLLALAGGWRALLIETPLPWPGQKRAGERFLARLASWWQASWAGRAVRRLGLRGLDWPVLALVVVGFASTSVAVRQGVALREWRMVFIDAALLYWLVTHVLRTPVWNGAGYPGERGPGASGVGRVDVRSGRTVVPCPPSPISLWPAVDGLLAGLVLVSAVALWQLTTGQGRIDVEGVWRVRGFYGSPNNLALVLDRGVPLAVAVAMFSTTLPLRRWLYGIAAPVLALACIATFSKGALLLGLPVGVGLVVIGGAWRSRRRWPLAILAVAVLLSGLFLAAMFRTPRFADLTNFQAGTSFIRLKLWQGALNMALDHPWLGVGPDNFLYAYRTHYVLPSAWEELNLSHPHNILLDLWTRLGIAGLATGAWVIVAGVVAAWRLFADGQSADWPLALGILGALAATVAHGLIDNSLFLIDLMAIFMLMLGLLQTMQER